MIHLLIPGVVKAIIADKKINENRSSEDERRSVFDKYSATERFEDIINSIKAILFKLQVLEERKEQPDLKLINTLRERRLYLADVQQRQIKGFSINKMESLINFTLLPELKSLQTQYAQIEPIS